MHTVCLSIRHLHKKNAAALRQVFAGMGIIFAGKPGEGKENGGKPAAVMAAVLVRMPQQKIAVALLGPVSPAFTQEFPMCELLT